jgi:threonine/homoserine/homoserine lactone efflux protein
VIEKAALFGPVAWYILVMAVTPGPNNAMLAASGMNFGVRRTVPHILGVTIGVIVLFALCGLGLGVLFNVIPYAELTLAIVGSIYLAYLAWRIANAGAPSANEGAKAQ